MATTNSSKKTTATEKAQALKNAASNSKLANAGKGQAGGFINFVREQGVVGLAVGLAIGTAAGASVKTIVDNFISPIVGLLTRGVDLSELKWVILEAKGGNDEVAIGWGAIISSLITLLATAFVIYWLVHIARLDRLDRKKS